MLKKRLKTANRGHKLLSDKQVELVKRFIVLISENKRLRAEVESEFSEVLMRFMLARATMSDPMLEEAIMFPSQFISLEVDTKNIMSVNTPVLKIVKEAHPFGEENGFSYGFANTSGELDIALDLLQKLFGKMIELAEVEKTCQLMASEIERTRRRVNVLEYVMIPQLNETTKYIKMKLDENERESRIRLMKVKAEMGYES